MIIGDKMMDLVARRFRTLGEPSRLRVLQLLAKGEMKVGDIAEAIDGNQPNVSKHLQILHETGMVIRRRAGNTVLYSVGDPLVFQLCELVCNSEAERSKREYAALESSASANRW